MQKLENDGLFEENAKKENEIKIKFFNLGPKTNWKDCLNNEIIENINTKFYNEMVELGYL